MDKSRYDIVMITVIENISGRNYCDQRLNDKMSLTLKKTII